MRTVVTPALLVRSVGYGESDLVATFFTESDGKISTIVRGARRSKKRFGGGLEPIHELSITFEDKGKELATLKESKLSRARLGLTGSLEAMDAAGMALRWIRHGCPPRTPEPEIWQRLAIFLDALDHGAEPEPLLAELGLAVLSDLGYGLDFERCIKCGRVCPPDRPAMVGSSGIVCSACGGAARKIDASLLEAAARGTGFSTTQAKIVVEIVGSAMAAHADFDPSTR